MLNSNPTPITSQLYDHFPRSRNDKLNWIFNVYDKDAGGTIDPGEMKDVVTGLYTMMGIEVPEEILEIRSKEILEICDIDGDGEISKEEFITHSLTCDFICDMLQVMEDDDDDFEVEEEEIVKEDPVVDKENERERAIKENISATDIDPNLLVGLATKLALPLEQVKSRHKEFLEKFPQGRLTKQEFIASRLKSRPSVPEEKAQALFKVFQGNGTMDFIQFEMAVNATTLR